MRGERGGAPGRESREPERMAGGRGGNISWGWVWWGRLGDLRWVVGWSESHALGGYQCSSTKPSARRLVARSRVCCVLSRVNALCG
jgi:hypothetical protein